MATGLGGGTIMSVRMHFSLFCLGIIITAQHNVRALELREISTDQNRIEVSVADWPKGLFYALENLLYRITFRDCRLSVHPIRACKVDPPLIAVDLSDLPGTIRMRAVTSDFRDILFVQFSGDEQFIVKINLHTQEQAQRLPYSVYEYTNTVRYITDWAAILAAGQSSSMLVHEDGSNSIVGPEIFHGMNCCTYAAAAVSENRVALNVDRGLRIYSKDDERIVWQETEGGFIHEIASAGRAWVAIESGLRGESFAIRLFLPQDDRFVSRLISLPDVDNSAGMADGTWRITDYGHNAIVWSRRSSQLFRVSDQAVELFKLDDAIPRGRVCPASSGKVFLVDSKGYTTISFTNAR